MTKTVSGQTASRRAVCSRRHMCSLFPPRAHKQTQFGQPPRYRAHHVWQHLFGVIGTFGPSVCLVCQKMEQARASTLKS